MENITGKQVMYAILFWVYLKNTLEIYVSYRQILVYKNGRSVPRDLRNYMNEEQYHKARLYGLDRIWYSIAQMIVLEMLLTTVELLTGLIAYFWYMAVALAAYFRIDTTNEVAVSCFFYIVLNVYCVIVEMPFHYYETITMEERHGFNRQSRTFFLVEYIMEFAISTLAAIPLVVVILFIVLNAGEYFFFWLWFYIVVVSLISMTLFPVCLTMLSEEFKPLEEGPLKKSIEELAASLDFPLANIYVVEESKRSGHSNAYFFGMWNSKRIVLYDNLLLNRGKTDVSSLPEKDRGKGCTNDEVLAVLAHELGHWKRGHFTILLSIVLVYLLLLLYTFQSLAQFGPFYEALGFKPGETPIFVGLTVVLTYVMSPVNTLFGFVMHMISRQMEYDADGFAHSLGLSKQLGKSLIKLHAENLIFPEDDWLYSTWNNSHPTLMERLQRLQELDEGWT